MSQDRSLLRVMSMVLLILGGLCVWIAGKTANDAVWKMLAPYNGKLIAAKWPPLTQIDLVRPHKLRGQMYPKEYDAGVPCGSNCMAWRTVQQTQVAHVPVVYVGALGVIWSVMGLGAVVFAVRPNPRRNLINYERDHVQIPAPLAPYSLPIIQSGRSQWGLMRRHLPAGGRRELGNVVVCGAPGRGKSNLLKYWLLTSDALNFVVLDLKSDLWRTTAGHRAGVSQAIRFDLDSVEGDAFDPLDVDDPNRARAVIGVFLPTDLGSQSNYFNSLAAEVAMCYWQAARQTGQSAIAVLVQAATLHTADMLQYTRQLITAAPPESQAALLVAFRAAFGLLWDNPEASGERNSMVQSFKAAFAPLNTPGILSTLSRTTFDPARLVEEPATLYISAPSTQAPYKLPIEALLGGVILAVNHHVDQVRAGQQRQDIVILADEAGILHVPLFADTLAGGRSRGISVAAFLQTLGQLGQYDRMGWRGLVDTVHHWVWFRSNDPDAHEFLRHRCGVYDKPSDTRDPAQSRRHPFDEVHAYDEIRPGWAETDVLALLDYDRTYPVFGAVINPYQSRALTARMRMSPPPLPTYSVQQLPVLVDTEMQAPDVYGAVPATEVYVSHLDSEEEAF